MSSAWKQCLRRWNKERSDVKGFFFFLTQILLFSFSIEVNEGEIKEVEFEGGGSVLAENELIIDANALEFIISRHGEPAPFSAICPHACPCPRPRPCPHPRPPLIDVAPS